MGIPSYFRHLCQTYPHVIQSWKKSQHVHNLYLDSNSIIYDTMRTIPYVIAGKPRTNADFENELIQRVCDTINEYMTTIQPTHEVFICFDGVAPIAKLEQQRDRRFKSQFMSNLEKQLSTSSRNHETWNQTAITPGTEFMDKLNASIKEYYARQEVPVLLNLSTALRIMVSGSDEAGEGEHKIFEYIRANPTKHKQQTTVIYGLDADLIILCLNHSTYGRLLLYRETPAFVQNFSDLEPNQSYVLDIHKLQSAILHEMTGMTGEAPEMAKLRVYDYLILTFMLGNDFLPHFPALCLRTRGMDILMNQYRDLFGRGKELNKHTMCVVNPSNKKLEIHWATFRKFVEALARQEQDNWVKEYEIRAKWEHMPVKMDTTDLEGNPVRVTVGNGMEKHQVKDAGLAQLLNIPVKQRELEYYIRPEYFGWQKRYYDVVMGIRTNQQIKQACLNYLCGLEWVLLYYSRGCPDWKWCYEYSYPPLLEDLRKYIPGFQQPMLRGEVSAPVLPIVQLMYVLPKSSHELLPEVYRKRLQMRPYRDWYPDEAEFMWAFCRYFWECHVLLPKIDIRKLEQLV